MKILALGDIFGRSGRKLIITKAADIKEELKADFLIVNCENASGGSGLTEQNAKELLKVGAVDVFTSGNHIWDKRDNNNIMQSSERLIRPANYPEPCPGKGWGVYRINSLRLGVVNLSGCSFMEDLDNPFIAFDKIYQILHPQCDIICVDLHAEATSEKIAFGYYADKRANVIFGTHTHVQTADERILEGGSGYITDLGMCGPYDGVIGVDKDIIIKNFLTKRHVRFEVASGSVQLNGALFTLDENAKCVAIERIRRIYE